MEQVPPVLDSGSKAATTPFYLTLDHRASTSSSPPAEEPTPLPSFAVSDPSRQSSSERGSEIIKAKIMSHRLYPALLTAFIDCRKVGAPPEVAGRLSALAGEVEMNSEDRQEKSADPELDQFMEMYCHMLVRYRQEVTRPVQEADEFFRSIEAQIDSFSLDDNGGYEGGGGSSDEDEQETADFAGLPAVPETGGSPSGEDKELKNRLLNKYSGYLSSLWRELSRKKKKGKLPRDARQKLLHWWQLHYRWPYPSELEKTALAESTGLDAKQINNWFINQRKRHWKPAPPALALATDYRLHHPHGGGASTSAASAAARRVEGQQHYFTDGSSYPRGP